MALEMATPLKRGGSYRVRKKVPDDLRRLVHRTEEKFSARTRIRAKPSPYAKAMAENEEPWLHLRHGCASLRHKLVWAIVGEI